MRAKQFLSTKQTSDRSFSQSKLRLQLHRQFRQAVELVEEVTGGVPLPLGGVMVLRLKRQREGRLVFLALSGVRFRLRIGQDPGGNVGILQSFERGVLGQKCI